MNAELNRRIRTVHHNDQKFSGTEIDLLHTPAVQRLYDLHQLGLADRVFIDASHSRLHHVVGVIEQADKMMRSIIANLEKHPEETLRYAGGPDEGATKAAIAKHAQARIMAVRLMAMLHDLTHAPYGHTLEDEIELVEQKHDEPARQANAFYRLVLQYFGWIERNDDPSAWGADSRQRPKENQHEAMLNWYLDSPELHEPPESPEFIEFVVKRWRRCLMPRTQGAATLRKISPRKLAAFLKDLAFAMRALVHLDLAHKPVEKVKTRHVPDREYPVDMLLRRLLEEAHIKRGLHDTFLPQRDVFLLDVIGNTICADLLDYARRDAANAGLRLDYDSGRIVDNMTVVSSAGPLPTDVEGREGPVAFPFADACLRTCVSLFSHKLRTDVPGELLNLLQVRYFVYERMLYHPTKCVAGAVLGAAIQFIGWKRLPAHWRFIGDQVFLYQVSESARLVRDLLFESAPTTRFSPALVQSLRTRIQALPTSGIGQAAIQILEDRLVTREEVIAHLEVMKRFRSQRDIAKLLLPELQASQISMLDDAGVTEIRRTLAAGNKESQAVLDATNWLEKKVPTVGSIREELKAGLRLLDRLGARRYLKITFRLLPNARVQGLHGVDATKVADLFKKPTERKIAEREIERRAGLPPGSVVIHCPPVKGPTKIAKILIASADMSIVGHEPKVEMLNNIGAIDPAVFEKHQHAIKALEEMYASTWRFAVSIAPPHDAKWRQVNAKVGDVLHELLTGGSGSVKNDDYTVREITALETGILKSDSADSQATTEADGATKPTVNSEQSLLVRLGTGLRIHPEFSKLSLTATDSDIVKAFDQLQSRILRQKPQAGLQPMLSEIVGPKPKRSSRLSEEDVFALLDECLNIEGLKRIGDEKMKNFVSSTRKLGARGLDVLRSELGVYASPTRLMENALKDQNREAFFRRLNAALEKAEKANAATEGD